AQAALRLIGEQRHIGPTLVTVHLHDVEAAQAFAEIAKQLHFELLAEPPELWKQKQWPKVSLDAEQEPFWAVMLSLCRQVGVDPDLGQRGRLRIADSG